VLYYHSYDFDGTIPGLAQAPSAAMAKQALGRKRISASFWALTRRYGSRTCCDV
jgi:hypothetical protein